MIEYIRKKIEKIKLKRTFKEYDYKVVKFSTEQFGLIEYAQWLHPFEMPKHIKDEDVNFYRSLSKENGLIIDIGAHSGDTAVPMALAVGREGLVLALEPNQYAFKILKKNATLNAEKTRIVPLPFAATEHDGEFVFNYSDASFCNGGFLSEIENQRHHHNYQLKVVGKNLEKYLYENYPNELHRLQLIKVDAEGYDKEILKTIPTILSEFKPNLLVECYKRLSQHEREELFDIIAGHGYDLFYHKDFAENRSKIKILRSDMMAQKHFDMVAIHQTK